MLPTSLRLGSVFFVLSILAVLIVRQPPCLGQPSGAGIPTPQSGQSEIRNQEPVPVPEPSEKAMSYYRGGNVLWFVGTLWGLLVPAVLLFTGWSARIRDLSRRLGRGWFLTVGLYFVFFTLLLFVVDFPLSLYSGFVREHSYELSNQTFGKWLGDSFKELIVSLIFGFLIIWIPYWLLRRSPRRWWLYTSMALIPVIFLMLLIAPVFIDPLFNKFGPMQDKALEGRILDLAHRAGIDGDRVYEVDKSVDTTKVNAYVTGFLGTKRIVLWDTIIQKLEPEELLFVVGHEMGHYVLGHVVSTVLFLSAMAGVLLYAVHRLSAFLIGRYKHRFGFAELSDVASLPLLLLLIGLLSLAADPVILGYSRHHERQADQFGLEITRDNHAAATGFIKLQQENLSNPRPGLVYEIWRASHPPIGERIDFCNAYRPWVTGDPLVYEKYFRK